jgi:uncharacterized protein
MTELARRYAVGDGCPRDAGQAILWYRRAAQQGEPGAMVAIGDMLVEGRCVDQDFFAAVVWYRRAADAGFAPGMTRLAEMLENGRGARVNETGAHEWYGKAARMGYGPAMTRLGDIEGDVEWYRKAVVANHPAAFGKMGLITGDVGLFRRGAELGDGVSMTELGRVATDPVEAAECFKRAAEAGDPNGMERYAHSAEHGRGMPESLGEAMVWYKKAAEAGQPAALTRLGILTGDKKLVKRAVDANYAPAMSALARMQPEDAEVLYQAAADLGEPEALFRVGRVEESAARGYPDALAKVGKTEAAAEAGHVPSMIALGQLRKAAETGDPEGLYRYGLSLTDRADGANWIRRAAEKGHARAMTESGLRSQDGTSKRLWFERAANAGDPDGMYRFGLLADDKEWLRKAAERNHLTAMVALGEPEWLEKAAAAGYANAFTKLGQLEKAAGMGDPEARTLLADQMRRKKPREAYSTYAEIARSGYAPAMTRLGDCALKGIGTSTSEVDALKWYRAAAHAGDTEAVARLRGLGKWSE